MSNTKYTLCLKNGQVMINDQLVRTNVYITDDKITDISDRNLESEKVIET